MPTSSILWGPTYENTLVLVSPLLDIMTDRMPRAGSEWVQAPSGVEDAWITGLDYTLTCRAAFIPDGGSSPTPLSGALSWQAFFDWGRQKNPFRFVPDATLPAFYVDGCYLVDPLNPSGGLGVLGADIKRQITFTIRNPTVDFHRAMRGVLFDYAPGMDLTSPLAATFARATAATRRGLPGSLAAAVGASDASGILRDRHYEAALRTTLLEAARTQLVPDPENFAAAGWTVVGGTGTRTGAQADPFGGTNAYLIADTDVGVVYQIRETVAFTGNGQKAVAIFLKAGASGESNVRIRDDTTSTDRWGVKVTWTAGVPSLSNTVGGDSAVYAAESWGNGWYRIMGTTTSGLLAANSHTFVLTPTNFTAASTGDTYFFGANAWNAVFPSSYQGPSLTTRNADSPLYWPLAQAPQPMFWLLDFIEHGREATSGLLGTLNNTDPRFDIDKVSATQYRVLHGVGGVNVSMSVTPSPAAGDRLQLLALLNADGSVGLNYAKNLGTEVVGTPSGPLAFGAAWNNAVIGLQGWSSGLVDGSQAIVRMRVGILTFGGVTRNTIAAAVAA